MFATTLVSSDGGAFIDLGGGAANVAETAGGDIIDMGTANEDGQAGDELVKLTQESPAQGTCVVFGKNCGHSVIQSELDQTDPASYNSDTQTYKGLNNLHIVLAGLNKDDVELFYKTIYLDAQSDPYRAVTVPGYIQIKSTGETLVLPDSSEDPNFHIFRDGYFDLATQNTQYEVYSTDSGNYFISDIDNKTYALFDDLPLVLPSSFSLTFADGSTVSGADAAKLFTSHEKAEHINYESCCQGACQSVLGITGPTRNAPDKYLAAEQNTGAAAPNSQTASPGQDTLTGDGGTDVLDPAGNAVTLIGGGGNVAYVYKAGYGAVTVDNTSAANNGNMGTVWFGDGIAPTDLTFGTAGEDNTDLLVSLAQGGGVTVAGAFAQGGFGRIKGLAFADGSTLSFAAIKDQLTTGAPGSTDLRGFASDDVLDTKGYATQAEGGGGDDTYVFNRGYGQLAIDNTDLNRTGVEGALRFGASVSPADVSASRSGGDLVLTLSSGADQVTVEGMFSSFASALSEVAFNDGTVWTRAALTLPYTTGTLGDDTLTGVLGGDTFDGKGGNDYEKGRGGGDTFLFGPGYGTLELDETDYNGAAPNVLRFGAGITPGQVTVRGDASGNLVLTDGAIGDQVTLDGMADWSFRGVQQVAFSNGITWDQARLLQMATIGTAGGDTLYGSSGSPYSSSGSDVFDGKGGNDVEVGRGGGGGTYAYDPVLGYTYVPGGDAFVFNAGYGKLEIDERDTSYQPGNTLRLGAGITPDQVMTSSGQAGDLVLMIGANGDQVTIDGQNAPVTPKPWWDFNPQVTRGVQAIAFADGTTWTGSQLLPKLILGTSGSDTLVSSRPACTFDGRGGGDTETGKGGGDTFLFNPGYGSLEVDETDPGAASGPANVLRLGAGILPSQVSLNGDYDDWNLNVTVGTGGDTIVLDDQLLSSRYGVQRMSFADGTTWDRAEIVRQTGLGMPGKPVLYGSSGDDVFDPQGQAHEIWGWGGSDAYAMDRGYGGVIIHNNYNSSSPHGHLAFSETVASDQLWLARSGNDLVATILGTTDQAMVKSWFTNSGAPTADIEAAGGARLDTGLGQLVSSMASYQAANAGFNPATASAMPDDPSLRSAIAAAWHG